MTTSPTLMTDEDYANKVEWEGGFLQAFFSYGLKSEALEDKEGELYIALKAFEDACEKANLQELLADVEEELEYLTEEM